MIIDACFVTVVSMTDVEVSINIVWIWNSAVGSDVAEEVMTVLSVGVSETNGEPIVSDGNDKYVIDDAMVDWMFVDREFEATDEELSRRISAMDDEAVFIVWLISIVVSDNELKVEESDVDNGIVTLSVFDSSRVAINILFIVVCGYMDSCLSGNCYLTLIIIEIELNWFKSYRLNRDDVD